MHDVAYDGAARKQLAALPRDIAARVMDTADMLANWPHHGCDVKPLKGSYQHLWRLRIGEYRAVFSVDNSVRKITIIRVFHRGRGY